MKKFPLVWSGTDLGIIKNILFIHILYLQRGTIAIVNRYCFHIACIETMVMSFVKITVVKVI